MNKKSYTSPTANVCRVNMAVSIMTTSNVNDIPLEILEEEEDFNGEFRSKQVYFDLWDGDDKE